jgi:hypothetical protein
MSKNRNRLSKINFEKILYLRNRGIIEKERKKERNNNNIEEILFDFIITHE